MKKTAALILALMLLFALTPAAGADGEDFMVATRGGQTAEYLVDVDDVTYLQVDVYLDGVTDDRLLTALTFSLGFNPKQIEYGFNSQDLGETYLYAVNAEGVSMGSRSLIVKETAAQSGTLSFFFATDYGCRVQENKPLISLYFYPSPDLQVGEEIGFTLGKETEAESVRMSDQNGWGDYESRTVGANLLPFTVTAEQEGVALNAEIVFNSADVKYKGSTPYVTYNGTAQKPRVTVRDKDTGETIDPSYYSLSYRNNTQAGTATVTAKLRRGYKGSANAWFKIYLPAPTVTYVENRENGITITWDKVDGANGYVIYRRAWNLISTGWTAFERWNNTTDTTWTDTTVYAGTRYQYGVKAYPNDPMDNFNLGDVGPLKTTVRITTRKLNSITSGSKKLTVKWTGSKVFTGYQIQYATDAGFTKNAAAIKIASPGTYETEIKNLKAKTTYYVRLRSYHEFEGMTYFGEWSNVIPGKTK